MNTKTAGFVGALVGTLVTTVVFMSLSGGKVLAPSTTGDDETRKSTQLVNQDAPMPTKSRTRAPRADTAKTEAPLTAASSTRTKVHRILPNTPEAAAMVRALSVEVQRCRDENQTLQAEVDGFRDKSRKSKTYDLTPEELVKMAERCELRWDMPSPWGEKPRTLKDKQAEFLGLSVDERRGADEALATYHQQMNDQIRKIYVELTGDPNSGSMSLQAMFAEIKDKTPKVQLQAAYQRLARERAGIAQPPDDPNASPGIERVFRTLTTAGERAERLLGDKIGLERARELRAKKGGWNSRSKSSYGCP